MMFQLVLVSMLGHEDLRVRELATVSLHRNSRPGDAVLNIRTADPRINSSLDWIKTMHKEGAKR